VQRRSDDLSQTLLHGDLASARTALIAIAGWERLAALLAAAVTDPRPSTVRRYIRAWQAAVGELLRAAGLADDPRWEMLLTDASVDAPLSPWLRARGASDGLGFALLSQLRANVPGATPFAVPAEPQASQPALATQHHRATWGAPEDIAPSRVTTPRRPVSPYGMTKAATRARAAPDDADAAARLVERLLVDPAFRAEFRRDPQAACRRAGLDDLAAELSDSASGKAMRTLETPYSRDSLAGVMMAAAFEGIGAFELAEHVIRDAAGAPAAVRDVLSRVNLPKRSQDASGERDRPAAPAAEPGDDVRGQPARSAGAASPPALLNRMTATSPAAQALALLENSNVVLDQDGVADVRDGRIDPRVVAVLATLSEDHAITISRMHGDHPQHTTAGSLSSHHLVRAMDIAAVDGRPVNAANRAARSIVAKLAVLHPAYRPDEVGTPWQIDLPGYFTDADHLDHLHVAFTTSIGPSPKQPARSVVARPLAGTILAPGLPALGAASAAVFASHAQPIDERALVISQTAGAPDVSMLAVQRSNLVPFRWLALRELVGLDEPSDLDRIKTTFDTSNVELAGLFGVTRQAVSAWLVGERVPAERAEKVAAVAALADLLSHHLKAERIPGVVRRGADAYGGLTMLDLIRDDRHEELLRVTRASFDWSSAA